MLLFAVIEGCSLEWTVESQPIPDPTITDQNPITKTDSGTTPSTIDPIPPAPDAEPSDAGAEATIDDGGVDGGNDADAECSPARCDCDNDGFFDLTRAGCEDAGGIQDCDDRDNRTRPNQTFLEDAPTPPRNGDWNCKDGVERLYASNVACGLLALTGCAGVQGFRDNPTCGAEGTYIFCEVKAGLLCGEGTPSTRFQSCK